MPRAILLALFVLLPSPANAGEDVLRVRGAVEGSLARGELMTLRITATDPSGWQHVDELAIDVRLHDASLERLSFTLSDGRVLLGPRRIIAGTANELSGTYLELTGLDVATTTSGNRVEIATAVELLRDLPPGTRFVFQAVDDDGHAVEVTRSAGVEAGRGPGWAGLVSVAAAALVLGGVVGTRMAGRRAPTERPSVYRDLQRRIDGTG